MKIVEASRFVRLGQVGAGRSGRFGAAESSRPSDMAIGTVLSRSLD